MKLTQFKALTFDCYGTLIDWETGMIDALRPLVEKASRPLARDEILEAHARHESEQQIQTPAKPYRLLLAVVYRRLAEEWGVPVPWSECVIYGESVKRWRPFADTVAELRYLKQHFKLAILSNVDNETFAATNALLGIEFDAVYTAEDIGSYKPADRNFDYMLSRIKTLGLSKHDILHTAESLFHDHGPANRHGLANCWINRRFGKEGFGAAMNPGAMPKYDFTFPSLADLVKAHQAEQTS